MGLNLHQRRTNRKERISELPFGTLELDEAGTVLRFEGAGFQSSRLRESDVIGRNFFKEIAPAERAAEMQNRFNNFLSDGDHQQKSSLVLLFSRPAVRILLLQTCHWTTEGRKRSAHIRIERER